MDGNVCDFCSKTFRDDFALREHQRRNHRNPLLSCFYCSYTTRFKFHLTRHMIKNQHGQGQAVPGNRKISHITCPLCMYFQCQPRAEMINHYVTVHDVDVEEKLIEFSGTEEFSCWKRETEAKGSFRFVKNTVNKTRHNVVEYLRCFRDGFFRSSGKGKRRLKAKGSCKSNSVCPCSLKVVISKVTGRVSVNYISSHVGHTVDIGRMNLTGEQRLSIAQQRFSLSPTDAEPVDIGELVISEREDDLEAEVVENPSAENRSFNASSCRDLGRAKESLNNKFSDLLNFVKSMDGVEAVNKALDSMIPTLQALESGLVFKSHGESKSVAKSSPQKPLYSTEKAGKIREHSVCKPSNEEREKFSIKLKTNDPESS